MLSVPGQMAQQSPALNNAESQASPFSNCAPSIRTQDEVIYYPNLLRQYLLCVQVKLFFIAVLLERNALVLYTVFIQAVGPYNLKVKNQLNGSDFLLLFLVRSM